MAQVVAGFTLRWVLTEMGKAIPGAAGGWLFKVAADKLSGGDASTEKIRSDIKALANQVSQVQTSVDQLSKQLSNVLLELRFDRLTSLTTKITASYDGVFFALQECLNMPKDWTEQQRASKLQDARIRVEEILRLCVNELPTSLEGIHSLLNSQDSQSVLSLAKARSLDNSLDFLSYVCKMKAFALPFWIAEAKALSLLQMAVDTPSVHFAGGESTVKKYNDYATTQEGTFNHVVGTHVLSLVDAVMKKPHDPTPVEWQIADHQWLVPYPSQGVSHISHQTSPHPWVLKPVSDISQPKPDGSYAFEMFTFETKGFATWGSTGLSWGGYGASM